jgi:electron transport complex protein RnfG
VKKDKVESVEALPNMETPKFFRRISEELLPKFVGMKFEESEKVDALTGATMSSNAVKANMKAAYDYYKKNK